MDKCKVFLRAHWKTIIVITTPLTLLPLLGYSNSQEAKCAYALLIIAIYWLTEALPIAITSLLPVVLFPLLQIVPAKEVSLNYLKDTNMLLLGALVMAVSIEHSGLHKRVALKMLLLMGTTPKWLMLSFMVSTWFLSMWISNTASAAMMIAVATAVLEPLRDAMVNQTGDESIDTCSESLTRSSQSGCSTESPQTSEGNGTSSFTEDDVSLDISLDVIKDGSKRSAESIDVDATTELSIPSLPRHKVTTKNERLYLRFARFFPLCVAYGANIGGLATLTGTPSNLILKNQVERVYEEHHHDSPVTFATWLIFGLPISVTCLIVAWVWVMMLYSGFRCFGKGNSEQQNVSHFFRKEYMGLGAMSLSELSNIVLTSVLIVLWLTRNPGFVPGWGSLFGKGFVSDSVPVIFIVLLLFILPAKKPTFGQRIVPVLNVRTMLQKTQWGVILLVGGGFALADACGKSGLSKMIGGALGGIESLPNWAVVMLVASLVAGLTELTTNSATTNVILPIVAELANNIGMNPLRLMLPTTIAASFSFMLPVATPANAVVVARGGLRMLDMARAGVFLNIVCVVIATVAVETWGKAIFKLDHVPWQTNETLAIVNNVTLTTLV